MRFGAFDPFEFFLDAVKYPAEELADLYLQRWDVELFFRDIKTTMGMDVLRCQTPEMIQKEVLMYLIAYNCIRQLMAEAAKATETLQSGLSALRAVFRRCAIGSHI